MSIDDFKKNFGGYVLALIVVLGTYAAVDAIAPKYATMFALVTLLGIAMFNANKLFVRKEE